MSQIKVENADIDQSTTKKDKAGSNFKLITTTSGVRVSQACDRCRIKKIKCDGLTPCHNCSKIGFECKTSDKLTRRAFPKGYTETLEKQLKEMEDENRELRERLEAQTGKDITHGTMGSLGSHGSHVPQGNGFGDLKTTDGGGDKHGGDESVTVTTNQNNRVQINNPIDQIFNVDNKGIIIGNDNLNFESQFNHLLINLNLPFLKITNSHNFLLNDPNSYLYHPSYTMYTQFHNRDLDVIYNPLTANNSQHDDDSVTGISSLANSELPKDIYDLFIKLVNNFKNLFNNKKELDNQVQQFFLNYNIFIPIFDYKQFMESYDAFHTMYPFMFTYDDATINGFNILNNDYHVVNEYLMVVVQIYAMVMMNDPTINLNLLLNHIEPGYSYTKKLKGEEKQGHPLIRSLYDFLPYFNVFHVSIPQLQTYLLFLYYSLLTNNKEKSLVLSSLVNAFIGILGINLNTKNLFFNDLTLSLQEKRVRVKIFWVYKVLLKCFNLKFGFKPSLNTTVINPVTIDRYFELTPAKLSLLLETKEGELDELFEFNLKPSIEFLNLVNIIIPSSFSPNYYQYLKGGSSQNQSQPHRKHPKHLDWILNDDDGDGNDGNLNYNFTQFSTIDKNLSNWRYSLQDKNLNLVPLHRYMDLPMLATTQTNNLYLKLNVSDIKNSSGITQEGVINYMNTGLPDVHTASQLIKIQLNFHCLLIRSMNYLNFVIDKELTSTYNTKITNISKEVLAYFLLIFAHVGEATEVWEDGGNVKKKQPGPTNVVLDSLGLDVDEDGFVINDFSVKRRKNNHRNIHTKKKVRQIPPSIFNYMLNGLSMTIINLKKSILLQILYLLICQLRLSRRGGLISTEVKALLVKSIDLFINVFINYELETKSKSPKKSREDILFKKLMNDELRVQILREPRNNDDSDEEDYIDGGFANELEIDWDDEEMDEDLKYLKIIKFIKYKIEEMCLRTPAPAQDVSLAKRNSLPLPQVTTSTFPGPIVGVNSVNPSVPGISPDPAVDSVAAVSHNNNSSSHHLSSIRPEAKPTHVSNFYTSSLTPNSQASYYGPQPDRLPSISKFDFLVGEDSYPTHTSTTPSFNMLSNSPPANLVKEAPASKNDLLKKEKLVINDLINMKHANRNYSGVSPWNYASSAATPTNVNVNSRSTISSKANESHHNS